MPLPLSTPKARIVTLLALSAVAGCKQRVTTCEKPSYFRRIAPATSFATAARGPEVKREEILVRPEHAVFKDGRHVTLGFRLYGHTSLYADLVFLHAVEEARPEKGTGTTYPMARIADGSQERLRIGFRSALCSDEEFKTSFCLKHSGGEVDLLAEMTCRMEVTP